MAAPSTPVLADPVEMIRSGAPQLIQSEEQLRAYTETLEKLDDIEDPTMEQWAAIELLTLLIEKYEQEQYPFGPSTPARVLRFLMDQHSLKQRDLAPLLGTESIVSEILNGKRNLTVTHIQRLSERFHVSPEVFFPLPAIPAAPGKARTPAKASRKAARPKTSRYSGPARRKKTPAA